MGAEDKATFDAKTFSSKTTSWLQEKLLNYISGWVENISGFFSLLKDFGLGGSLLTEAQKTVDTSQKDLQNHIASASQAAQAAIVAAAQKANLDKPPVVGGTDASTPTPGNIPNQPSPAGQAKA